MSLQLHRIYQLSKWFLRQFRPRRSYFIFLFFLVLSFIFWVATSLNSYYDEEISVPVHITGIPKGLVISTDECDTIRVTIHEKGYDLLTYIDSKKSKKDLDIDFSSFTRQSEKAVLSGSDLQKRLQTLFGAGTTVQSIKPDHLEVAYCMGEPKKVPVVLNGKFIPSDNRYLSDTIIQPRMVTVYGSRQTLSTISYVTTEAFTLTNYSDTVKKELNITRIPGTRIVPSKVAVKFCPDILMEQTVEALITPVNVPDGINLRTFPMRVKITYTAGMFELRKISTNDFIVQADYNDIHAGSDKCPIRITRKPKKVMKAKLEVDRVDYLIEEQ